MIIGFYVFASILAIASLITGEISYSIAGICIMAVLQLIDGGNRGG